MMVLHHSSIPAVVLIVEDEMLLRMRAVDMVEDAGYTSVEAVDADAAFAILEPRSDIALLFTDIQMPGSTAIAAHLERKKEGPTVQAPTKRSFGTRLIETLGKQLKGEVQLTYEPSGFVYALDVSLASLTSSAAG